MNARPSGFVACPLLVLGGSSAAPAFSPAPAQRHDVFSPNRAFVLDVDPEKEVNTVYAANDRSLPLWSFRGRLWLSEVLLSNDGNVVAIVQWEYIREQDIADAVAVSFQNKDGVFKTYSIAELCPNPKRTRDVGPGPIGEFWRTWYTGVRNDGDRFVLHTTGRYDYEFRFSDGSMTGKSRFWRYFTRSFLERNALAVGGVFLYGLLFTLLAFGYWQRRRELRRANTGTDPPARDPGASATSD